MFSLVLWLKQLIAIKANELVNKETGLTSCTHFIWLSVKTPLEIRPPNTWFKNVRKLSNWHLNRLSPSQMAQCWASSRWLIKIVRKYQFWGFVPTWILIKARRHFGDIVPTELCLYNGRILKRMTKSTKHAKFPENRIFLTLWYAPLHVRFRG